MRVRHVDSGGGFDDQRYRRTLPFTMRATGFQVFGGRFTQAAARAPRLCRILRLFGFANREWCCQTGLNCRPLHYQWSALPLSYGSMTGGARIGREAPRQVRRSLPQAPRLCKRGGGDRGPKSGGLAVRRRYPCISANCGRFQPGKRVSRPSIAVADLPGPARRPMSPGQARRRSGRRG